MNNKKIKSTNIQTSISSVIGSATSFYIAWLKNKFGEGFFKDTYVAGTTLTSLETQRRDIYKKPKPLLIVKPEYAGENGFIETLPYWHNTLQYVFNSSDNYYTPVMNDALHKIKIHAIPDRIKINFPTRILIPTKIYGINLLHYMKNIIEPGGHAFINNVFFENELPSSFTNIVFDYIFNNENRKNNKEIDNQLNEYNKESYKLETQIIDCLQKLKELSKASNTDPDKNDKILKYNLIVADNNRQLKTIKKEMDKIKENYKEILSLADPNDEIRKKNQLMLEDYFNTFSNSNVTCRMNTSTGNMEYSFKNRSNILIHMDSLPMLDSIRKGRVEDYAVVSFEVSFDFNTNSNFILEVDPLYEPNLDNMEMFKQDPGFKFNLIMEENVPEYINDNDKYFILRKKQKFTCEFNKDIDVLPFDSILDEESLKMYNSTTNYEEMFKIKIFLDGSLSTTTDGSNTIWKKKELTEGIDFIIDWAHKCVNMIKPISNVNYLFAIYNNQYEFNKSSQEEELYSRIGLKPIKQ